MRIKFTFTRSQGHTELTVELDNVPLGAMANIVWENFIAATVLQLLRTSWDMMRRLTGL